MRARISRRDLRGSMTDGKQKYLVISIAVLAAGGWMVLLGLGWVDGPEGETAPPVLAPYGALFAILALKFALSTARSMRGRSRAHRVRAQRPGEPWAADYRWNEIGEADRTPQRILDGLFVLLVLGFFLGPVVWFLLRPNEPLPWYARAAGALFGLMFLVPIVPLVTNLATLFCFGRTWVRFHRFPFGVKDEIDVTFEGCRSKQLQVTLRYVEERIVHIKTGQQRTTEHVADALYVDRFPVTCPEGRSDVRIHRRLPDQPTWTNQMVELPMRYWELLIESETPEFHATFALPVYDVGAQAPVRSPKRHAPAARAY